MRGMIREFFFLRKGERRALLLVLFLLLCTVTIRVHLAMHPPTEVAVDTVFYNEMLALRQAIEAEIAAEQNKVREHDKKAGRRVAAEPFHRERKEVRPFPFDPNTLSADSLRQMQLRDFVVRNIVSYREAGGVFQRPEDIDRIYGLEPEVAEILHPYIHIDSMQFSGHGEQTERLADRRETIPVIDLNRVDTAGLILVPGIGGYYASRILKYRELLGGYMDFNQIWEVYGMDSVKFRAIEKHCRIDTQAVKKIRLNQAGFRELIAHPYINRSETYAILQYRDYAGEYTAVEELLMHQIVDEERFKAMSKYLSVTGGEE